tara:strand:- start:3988 stop:4656 length:669 start_codon:yes stop_codon:yes gene_type:complete
MKLLANSKLLCALLAVVSVGMGVQTYYLVRVHRQLRASEVQAAETTAWIETSEADDDQTALIPADPRTSLVPVDPFADLDQAEERMRSLFDNFHDRFDRNFGDSWFDNRPILADGSSFLLGNMGQLGPRVDLQDCGDSYEVTVDVPGAEETEVVVRVEGDMLIVEGSCATSNEESEPGSFVRRERQFGRFERRLAIPQDADDSTLHTEYANGVSKVTLLKKS